MAINNSKTTRGPVRISNENNTGKFSSKNPNSVSDVNQSRGPTVGNMGSTVKRNAFNSAKAAWAATATMIANSIGARADNPKNMVINRDKNQDQISPNTNMGRGPRKGNK